jgi:cobalamin biosynthetic protein CobC
LSSLLDRHGFANGGTALFRYAATPRAPQVVEALVRRGILVRQFAEPAALRFGLPGVEAEWARLEAALDGVLA